MVALSAAHGYAQVSGRPQVVLVHVECGTQNLGGAVHNAARCRVPVLIFAGASPVTQEGELRGGRNEFIHWLQDVFDQRGIVRGYMKYENELRSGRNLRAVIGALDCAPVSDAVSAAAAGGAFARKVQGAEELPDALAEAVRALTVEGVCAVPDVVLEDLR
jgi:hypothetical protein